MTQRTWLRSLRAEDLPVLRAWMREEPGAPAWSDDDLGLLLADERASTARIRTARIRRGWAAESGAATEEAGRLVGFAAASALLLRDAAPECEFEFVMVAVAARRQGLGRALVTAVLGWARELAAREVWLEVRASNAAAQRLYCDCGFALAGRRPGYYSGPTEDALLLRCAVGSPREDAPV